MEKVGELEPFLNDGGERLAHRTIVESEPDRRFGTDEGVKREGSRDQQHQAYEKFDGFVHTETFRRYRPSASVREEARGEPPTPADE